ncbi:MAG TPA: NAD(P)/FAD-dependent oxidoreductase [Woeseiaceae bacterium]|nr:NAD(P)/FAD-dependent oxidoreductase [Woeseiaceae bacterium]
MSAGGINIVGAGLCGSLLAVILARRGYGVTLFERGGDPRLGQPAGRRSINLALAARGMRALEHADLMARVEPLLMPMRGRMIHAEDGGRELQPYGQRERECIYSVSRAELNRLLVDAAEHSHGVELRFRQEAVGTGAGVDPGPDPAESDANPAADGGVILQDLDRSTRYAIHPPVVAADGAGSAVRRGLEASGRLHVTESLLPHGYKELTLPPGQDGGFQLDPGALHIWPRGGFMLIALPNPGGDFTLTLFLANDGTPGFAELESKPAVEAFFGQYFADVAPMIPNLADSFMTNPLGVLGTVRCRRWHSDEILLIGDAAHAIVPFHGQGMNAAFEDCVLLDSILEEAPHDWEAAFARFEAEQLPNANAIADMALENYVEMRDTVRDPKFVLQKQLAFELERRLPDRFIPRYSMVMFHPEIPYAVARHHGAAQRALLDDLTQNAEKLEDIDLDSAIRLTRERLPRLEPAIAGDRYEADRSPDRG